MEKLSYVDNNGNINLVRGDTIAIKFQRKDSEDRVIETKTQKMWFTVKIDAYSKKKTIQKTLLNGISFTDNDYYYHIILNNNDTKDLFYIDYYYDIQVENNGVVATIKKGKLKIKEEITFEGGNQND